MHSSNSRPMTVLPNQILKKSKFTPHRRTGDKREVKLSGEQLVAIGLVLSVDESDTKGQTTKATVRWATGITEQVHPQLPEFDIVGAVGKKYRDGLVVTEAEADAYLKSYQPT